MITRPAFFFFFTLPPSSAQFYVKGVDRKLAVFVCEGKIKHATPKKAYLPDYYSKGRQLVFTGLRLS